MADSKKLLFTDLDATLLSSDKTVSNGNLSAIGEMIKRGHKFVLASGRPLLSVLKIAEQYGWDGPGYYISSYNGGLVYDCGAKKDILIHSIALSDVRFLLTEAHKAGLHAHTYDREHVVSLYDTPELNRYIKGIRMPKLVVDDLEGHFAADPPIKAIVISYEGRERLSAFQKSVRDYTDGRLSYTFSNPNFLEYAHILSSKGASLSFLAEFLGIAMENTIACGDEENDLSMIEAAGTGVVMQNGTDAVKSHADYITTADNDHDGIAEVIYHFIL
ncbi:MAG: HAD family phosphatase [Lachnospiraceae bacterium]|nr:HAD family phosphatase [Lachnospiraceae bacterium]